MEGNYGSKVSLFCVGLGVGALAGILFAPTSGEESRDKVTRKLQEGKDYAQRKTRELQDRAGDLVEMGRQAPQRVSAAFEAGREAYREEMAKAR